MVPAIPLIIIGVSVFVWLVRTTPKKDAEYTAEPGEHDTSGIIDAARTFDAGSLPKPFDAKAWDDKAADSKPVLDSLRFWAAIVALEPDYLLPTWIELTGEEQRMIVDGFTSGNQDELVRVVELALLRAEAKTDDAEMTLTAPEMVFMVTMDAE